MLFQKIQTFLMGLFGTKLTKFHVSGAHHTHFAKCHMFIDTYVDFILNSILRKEFSLQRKLQK